MSYVFTMDALVTVMLGWLRGFTDWVWSIISLGKTSNGFAFLGWFSNNWIKLVAFLVIVGLAADWLVWIIRWRPYWVWFGKKRKVIGDAQASAGEHSARRPQAPQFKSKAMARKSETAADAETEAATPDDLFDVVSPAFSVQKTPQKMTVSEGVSHYLQNGTKEETKAHTKKKELNWF